MDTKGFLDQLLQSGRHLVSQGQGLAERGFGVPTKGPERDAMLSGLGKGAAVAGVLGLLLGSRQGRELAGDALKIGGLAALGGIAYKTYRDWSASQTQEGLPNGGTPVHELTGREADQRSLTILRAMIAAAKADGRIDADERARLEGHMSQLALDPTLARAIETELDSGADPAAIARSADSPEAAAEIYLASCLVIDVDTWQEKAYLAELARHLNLAPGLVEQLQQQAAGARA
jgi:uncharacterized membrane protein YebE (DUF533 family)